MESKEYLVVDQMNAPNVDDPLALVVNPGEPVGKNTNPEDSDELPISNQNFERSDSACTSSTISRPPSPCMESPSTSCRQKNDPLKDNLEKIEDPLKDHLEKKEDGQVETSVEELMEQLHGEEVIGECVTPSESELDDKEETPLIKTPPPKKLPQLKTVSPEYLSKTRRRLTFSSKPTMKRMSKTRRAGLVLSVAKIQQRLKQGRYASHVGTTGAVFMTAVLEYLMAEVLELAGNCAKYLKKKRVFPRCIQLTLLHDKELEQLTKGVIIPEGGVRAYIHPELLPPKDATPLQKPQFSSSRGTLN